VSDQERRPSTARPEDPTEEAKTLQPNSQEMQEEPDAERGERIETGKAIARGGRSEGQVPGATESEKNQQNP
jgi:hypothetical protein